MPDVHYFEMGKLHEFMDMIDWSFVKRVSIEPFENGQYCAEITHYRSGRYMHHSFKHGWKP